MVTVNSRDDNLSRFSGIPIPSPSLLGWICEGRNQGRNGFGEMIKNPLHPDNISLDIETQFSHSCSRFGVVLTHNTLVSSLNGNASSSSKLQHLFLFLTTRESAILTYPLSHDTFSSSSYSQNLLFLAFMLILSMDPEESTMTIYISSFFLLSCPSLPEIFSFPSVSHLQISLFLSISPSHRHSLFSPHFFFSPPNSLLPTFYFYFYLHFILISLFSLSLLCIVYLVCCECLRIRRRIRAGSLPKLKQLRTGSRMGMEEPPRLGLGMWMRNS